MKRHIAYRYHDGIDQHEHRQNEGERGWRDQECDHADTSYHQPDHRTADVPAPKKDLHFRMVACVLRDGHAKEIVGSLEMRKGNRDARTQKDDHRTSQQEAHHQSTSFLLCSGSAKILSANCRTSSSAMPDKSASVRMRSNCSRTNTNAWGGGASFARSTGTILARDPWRNRIIPWRSSSR